MIEHLDMIIQDKKESICDSDKKINKTRVKKFCLHTLTVASRIAGS